MTESRDHIPQWIKDHRLFQAATVYAVAGWLLIQLADIILEAFEAPAWTMQIILLVVLVGFPVALTCVWLIERAKVDSPSRPKAPVIAIASAAALSAGVAYWLHTAEPEERTEEPATAEIPDARHSNPVLAVLPFSNMSSSAENEYVADGMTEDVITLLAQSPGIEVIARNSTFKFKNQSPDIRDVGRDLGVDYVVEGSIRPFPDRVRVTVQVIDTQSGAHVWAEKYDRPLSEFFDVQDEVSLGVAAAVGDAVFRQEYRAANQSRTDNLTAWRLTSRADVNFNLNLRDPATLALARDAASLDPGYALAHATLGRQLAILSLTYGWPGMESIWPGATAFRSEAEAEGRLAARLAPDDPKVLSFLAITLLWTGHPEEALSVAERVTRISPSYAEGLAYYGDILIHNGRSREAIPHIEKAIRLTPDAPQLGFYHVLRGEALMHHGDFAAAEDSLIKAQRVFQGENEVVTFYLAGTQLRLGNEAAARASLQDAFGAAGISLADAQRMMEFYSTDKGGEFFKAVWADLARL